MAKTPKNPKGAGRPRRFTEDTVRVVTEVPISRAPEFRALAKRRLARYEREERKAQQAKVAQDAPQDSK